VQLVAFVVSLSMILSANIKSERFLLLENTRTGPSSPACTSYYEPDAFQESAALAKSCTTFVEATDADVARATAKHIITDVGTLIGTIKLQLSFPNGTDYAVGTDENREGERTFPFELHLEGCRCDRARAKNLPRARAKELPRAKISPPRLTLPSFSLYLSLYPSLAGTRRTPRAPSPTGSRCSR
jgi:hypothetical protein